MNSINIYIDILIPIVITLIALFLGWILSLLGQYTWKQKSNIWKWLKKWWNNLTWKIQNKKFEISRNLQNVVIYQDADCTKEAGRFIADKIYSKVPKGYPKNIVRHIVSTYLNNQRTYSNLRKNQKFDASVIGRDYKQDRYCVELRIHNDIYHIKTYEKK